MCVMTNEACQEENSLSVAWKLHGVIEAQSVLLKWSRRTKTLTRYLISLYSPTTSNSGLVNTYAAYTASIILQRPKLA